MRKAMPERERVLTVTRDDCEWSYYRGPGAGGQHRNKTDSAVRCFHRPSGAIAQAADSRSQLDNRRVAFERMAGTPEFRRWLKIEVSRLTRDKDEERERVDAAVRRQMRKDNLKVEVSYGGEWVTPCCDGPHIGRCAPTEDSCFCACGCSGVEDRCWLD